MHIEHEYIREMLVDITLIFISGKKKKTHCKKRQTVTHISIFLLMTRSMTIIRCYNFLSTNKVLQLTIVML